ncbi:MAG: cupin domain-containing protein, partial [Clostridia bacterium]|nr:cupin domain-containing protein [Clostridia bacterium]
YCKKYIIVLPGQKHPEHAHRIKEETFQLLYGDLDVEIDKKTVNHMKPGDMQTVLRGEYHAFSSVNGAIFEEVSTQHMKSDSYYREKKISDLDPMERKTFLKKW